ncbi:MAG: thiamine pyrophosphate-binding protein, partial [Nocardioides sp.]
MKPEPTTRMTVGQALVAFLAQQWTLDGALAQRTVPGVFGIFGHGNLAGLGQALHHVAGEDPERLPYLRARNEQAMVHQAVGYARAQRRRATYAVTTSVGPGTANLVTGAALATANRLPVLLVVSDTFSTRVADPVLQQLEHPHDPARQVCEALRPVSRFYARVERGEQLFSIALAALRVLTDPAETGAVTIVLPEDVQAEAIDVPSDFLAQRRWHLYRPPPDPAALARAVTAIRAANRPLLIAGGGVFYAGAEAAVRALAELTGIPVATTQAGGGVLPPDHPQHLGGIGVTGGTAANSVARQADLIIGVGTRYGDFTTASNSLFAHPDVAFVNLNIAAFDAAKRTQLPVICDARAGLDGLRVELAGLRVDPAYAAEVTAAKRAWDDVVDQALQPTGRDVPGQPEILGAIAGALGPRDAIVAAAGSLPGDLQKLWRPAEALGYHVEYGFSCMGYEIAGGLGYQRGLRALGDDREVVVLVGDGSYLMLHTELATAAADGIR